MDDYFSILFFIWIIYAILSGIVRKKNLPSSEESTEFPNQTDLIEINESIQNLKSQSNSNSNSKKISSQQVNQSNEKITQESYLNFTSDDALNAMVLSEIFSKPKSLRRR